MANVTLDEMLQVVVNDAVFLRWAWGNYEYLFRGAEHRATLNAAGPGFFAWTEMLIVDDILMRISRLTDPAGNRWQENVTLEKVITATGWRTANVAKWEQFSTHLEDVRDKCSGCRAHRNKRISHADLQVSLKTTALPSVTASAVRDAMLAIENFIHAIYPEIRPNSQQSFSIFEAQRDVEQLVRYLNNRPSRTMTAAVSKIYQIGEDRGMLSCGFCGAAEDSYLPGPSGLNAERLLYWHFSNCAYIVGTETVQLHVYRYNEAVFEPIAVDLSAD